MLRTMQAAVHATEKRLTASRYLMQISAHLAFSYTKPVGLSLLLALQNTCHHKVHASQSESDLH